MHRYRFQSHFPQERPFAITLKSTPGKTYQTVDKIASLQIQTIDKYLQRTKRIPRVLENVALFFPNLITHNKHPKTTMARSRRNKFQLQLCDQNFFNC